MTSRGPPVSIGNGGAVASLNVLAVLLGILFIVMGVFEVIGGFMIRHTAHTLEPAHAAHA